MMNHNLLLSQIQEKIKRDKKIDKTPSIDLLKMDIKNKVNKILSKFSKDIKCQITDDEREFLLEARNQVQKQLQQHVSMCKVIPTYDINKYLSFQYDIGNFMLRKADLDNIINKNYCKNIVDSLYYCLRLDYCNSPYLSCDRMGIVELAIDNFACRVPLDSMNYRRFKDKKIEINNGDPYTGIGWTKSCYGVPEFYVTIANQEKIYIDETGKHITIGLGKFPIVAFSTNIYIADRESNTKVKIASYYNETCEDGSYVYDKFEQCSDIKTKEIRERIIKEESINI